jgi:putative FmdB family regulatory protein
MPLYEYKCSCGKRFDRLLKLAEYDTPQTCECGQVAEKQLSAPAVFGDFAAYSCPVTGRRIEGRKEHEANLRRHGCRVLEPGETQQASRRIAEEDAKLEEAFAETAVKLVEAMPAAQKEQLGKALETSEVAVVRQ